MRWRGRNCVGKTMGDERIETDMAATLGCYAALLYGPVWEWSADGESGKDRPRICCYDGAAFGEGVRPLGMPIGTFPKNGRRIYRCVLTFCGWGCLRAYNKYEFAPRDSIGTNRRDDLISNMYRDTVRLNARPRTPPAIAELFGDEPREPPMRLADRRLTTMRVPIAPPRQVLLTGAMTLHDFRAGGEPVLWERKLPPSVGIQLVVEGYRNKLIESRRQAALRRAAEPPVEGDDETEVQPEPVKDVVQAPRPSPFTAATFTLVPPEAVRGPKRPFDICSALQVRKKRPRTATAKRATS